MDEGTKRGIFLVLIREGMGMPHATQNGLRNSIKINRSKCFLSSGFQHMLFMSSATLFLNVNLDMSNKELHTTWCDRNRVSWICKSSNA